MLSRAQAEHFINMVQSIRPDTRFSIVVRDTAGDLNQQQLLQDMDGKDFFTKDIQDFLLSGQADFAVHSLKDVSSELFFKDNQFAVFSREDPRDVAIFQEDVTMKIAAGDTLTIGTSSPRRALMATRFLAEHLPTVEGRRGKPEAVPIRGNVDTRLRKLAEKQYDGIILAAAGLNRLLRYAPSRDVIRELLSRKRIMVLPLIECPPAPGQGALVAEARPGNEELNSLLHALNDRKLAEATHHERAIASKYGAGCHQQFGVVNVDTPFISFTYGSGVSGEGTAFSIYNHLPEIDFNGKQVFSFGDRMKTLFGYSFYETATMITVPALFVSSRHALHSEKLLRAARDRRIWTAGTKTWGELAKKGLWVEGCADALGLEFIEQWMSGPIARLSKENIGLITDEESAIIWERDGWVAHATYQVSINKTEAMSKAVSSADIIFWTSFKQYLAFRDQIKKGVIHCCSTGKTAGLFREAGIAPMVFPGIKGFNEWRKQKNIAVSGE